MSQYRGEILGSEVVIDLERTKEWYSQSEEWPCTCGHCRNFLMLAKQRLLLPPMMELLDKFSIVPEKATYVCELDHNEKGHLYEISYRVAGRMLEKEREDLVEYSWGGGGCGHNPYPYGAPGFPEPYFDLEFFVTLPWVLDEPDE